MSAWLGWWVVEGCDEAELDDVREHYGSTGNREVCRGGHSGDEVIVEVVWAVMVVLYQWEVVMGAIVVVMI